MPKRSVLALVAVVLACAGLPSRSVHAGVVSRTAAYLDEVSLDLYRAPDSLSLATGIDFGNVRRSGFYWTVGGRLSWFEVLDPRRDAGWGAGLVGGIGANPDRVLSPVFRAAVDRTLRMESYDWRTTLSVGMRVRVLPSVAEHLAVTVSAFRVDWMGKSGAPDEDDYGVALFYSAAVLEKR